MLLRDSTYPQLPPKALHVQQMLAWPATQIWTLTNIPDTDTYMKVTRQLGGL